MAAPLLVAAARAFGTAATRLGAAGGRLGRAGRVGLAARESYRIGSIAGVADPRAIIEAALNCDASSPGEAMAILARARARSVTGRLYDKVSEILSERVCSVPGESALVDAGNTVIGAAGTIAGAAAGGALLLGAAAWGAATSREPSSLEGDP